MEKVRLLYFFPHVFLKDAILNQWDYFFYKVIAQGPNTLKSELIKEFNQLKEDPKDILSNKDIMLDSTDFDSILANLNPETNAIIIKFPTPNETTDVAYIGILYGKHEEVLPRYFTLELHRPNDMEKQLFPERTSDKYEVCEWDKDNKHLLYGSIDSPDPTLFVEELKKVVNKQN